METCKQRLLTRNTGRSDDKEDVIQKRFETFMQKNMPVTSYYEQFGKVRKIDANRDVLDIYEDTRRAMLPQISCMIGPKASGKTTLGKDLCERTNMKLINYNEFLTSNNLCDSDEETQTTALIKQLSGEISPRVLLEDFPQSEFQAKFFIKNCVTPSRVFSLQCSKDICQERMTQKAQGDAGYQSSSILSKKIRLYNENFKKLEPYLSRATNLKSINTEQIFDTAFKQLCSYVEPTVLIVRPSGHDNAVQVRKEIIAQLCDSQGYIELNVHTLIKDENERHTEIGTEILSLVSAGKPIQNDLIVKMLRKIIYAGIEGRDKFILTDFPDSPEQAQEFEAMCSKIKAVLLASGPEERVELVDNNLSEDSINSYFQKDNRLKPLRGWDATTFQEQLGNKVDWAIVRGEALSGKTQIANMIAKTTKGKVINMVKVAEEIVPTLETEDGPFEGRVPDEKVEERVRQMVDDDLASGMKHFYLFDGFHHETVEKTLDFLSGSFGTPSALITTACDAKEIESRYKKDKEMEAEAELGEDDVNELKDRAAAAVKDAEKWRAAIGAFGDKVRDITFETGVSDETLSGEIRQQFCAKVIIVKHDKRHNVDVVCSNLAIKYNMLYISVYQLIKQEIESNSQIGQDLLKTKRPKPLNIGGGADKFDEEQYSAVHFDQALVIALVQRRISETRTSQKFILLEGMCNSGKLEDAKNRLELRFMDEFFAIEQQIGEVSAVINLTAQEE